MKLEDMGLSMWRSLKLIQGTAKLSTYLAGDQASKRGRHVAFFALVSFWTMFRRIASATRE